MRSCFCIFGRATDVRGRLRRKIIVMMKQTYIDGSMLALMKLRLLDNAYCVLAVVTEMVDE